ncbi:peroxide stress protein YaaA [Peptostreptococcus equinus]|uniref:UPF0246 protein O0R46_07445 n=1 Tax=Peptostreptococcus equinus TaxID=3003601 RepID=A0ABY7JPL3_9FIRM|nr:peroxide stress protein YaaA [Peptostreptococcus sp. CBA3647]WAW14429.1 peroxide stress protein YaaA [Peptostreptococcus sp. CBA3647]
MITFISPAKGFNNTKIKAKSKPQMLDYSKEIMKNLKKLSSEDISTLMKVNDEIAILNKERFDSFNFEHDSLPAIYAYNGLQYKNINIDDFDNKDIDFITKHLRILSGLYGYLRPMDCISPYRLEMMTKLSLHGYKNLYEFWSDSIFKCFLKDLNKDNTLLNLSSDEYSKTIIKHIKTYNKKIDNTKQIKFVTCTFKVEKSGKLKTESTASKIARGKMLCFITKNRINKFTKLKDFTEDNFKFRQDLSTEKDNFIEYIFVKTK